MSMKMASLTPCSLVPWKIFEMLGRKERAPLVVMAFWFGLFHRAEQGNRWMKFKKVREAQGYAGVYCSNLGPEFRELIRWPLKLEVHVAPPEQ